MDPHVIILDKSTIMFDCNCIIEEHDENGKLLSREAVHNKITDFGITSILSGNFPPTHFAVGTGTTPPAATDTAMGNEKYRAITTQQIQVGPTRTIKFYLDLHSANGHTLTEAGLFLAASGGSCLARIIHAAKVKAITNTITYTWVINGVST